MQAAEGWLLMVWEKLFTREQADPHRIGSTALLLWPSAKVITAMLHDWRNCAAIREPRVLNDQEQRESGAGIHRPADTFPCT